MKQVLSNEEILFLEALRRREVAAFQCLFERYGKALYCILLIILNDQAEAENTHLEVFVTAYEQIERYDPDTGSLWLWLLTISINKVLLSKEKIVSVFRQITKQI